MWILPLVLISAIAFAAASKSSRETVQPARQVQLPPPVPPGRQLQLPPPGLPGPIAMLGESLRSGQFPPRAVIFNAIVEAEALGRSDLASDIARVFFARPNQVYERGSCALPSAPRARADYQHGGMWALPRSPRESVPVLPPQGDSRQASAEEILATLHTDPTAFLEMAASGRTPVIDVTVEAAVPPASDFSVAAVAQAQETSEPGSPLHSVPAAAWLDFVSRLSREVPTFDSSRHVGQYRQRRDRLAELNIDPSSICGSPSAQRTALDVDLADAHGHAAAGGMLEYLGRTVVVPGHEGPVEITLSGVLGVIQCAGLEGAVSWLERAIDRKRYPHTSQVFLNTNGVF
jgi:hypothetical protein